MAHGKEPAQSGAERVDGARENLNKQTPDERRRVRRKFREKAQKIAANKNEVCRLDSANFERELAELERDKEQVQDLSEYRAEALVFQQLSIGLHDVALALRAGQNHCGMDFINAIRSKCGVNLNPTNENNEYPEAEAIDWVKFALLTTSASLFFSVPATQTMLGPMESKPKERKLPAQRRQRTKIGACLHPDEVEDADENAQKKETDANIETMFKILRKEKRVDMVALVLNRASFSQTVENVFTLSFLIKDGRAAIEVDDENNHYVEPKNAPSEVERKQNAAVNQQFIFRMDFRDWQWMKSQLPEGEELMPHRRNGSNSQRPRTGPMSPIKKTSRNRARETSASMSMGAQEDVGDEEVSRRRRKL